MLWNEKHNIGNQTLKMCLIAQEANLGIECLPLHPSSSAGPSPTFGAAI